MAFNWITIGAGFPATLNKDAATTDLKQNETPAGYGYSLTVPGRLAAGTVPTGTARTVKTYTIGSTTYSWIYNRLWLASGSQLLWGAPNYTETFFAHGLGKMNFPEASGNIISVIPFNEQDLGVLTPQGAYRLINAFSPDADMVRGGLIQELALADATYATELDGVIYVSNANGLFAWKGEQVEELTLPVRNNLTGFTSAALTCDYQKKRIIGTSKFVYDVNDKALYDYNTSGFLYTSPTIVNRGERPMVVYKLAFTIEHVAGVSGSMTVQVRHEEQAWTVAETVTIPYSEENFSRVEYEVPTPQSVQRFAIRITALSAEIRIKSVQAYIEGWSFGDQSA